MRLRALPPTRSDLALVDINELIRFRGNAGAPPVKAVFVLFNKSPYAIVARKSRGIHALSDIEGKTLGVAEGDLSIRLWPALARHQRHQDSARQAEPDQRRGARADIVGGTGRCGRRLLLSVGGQFEGSRRSGRRPRRASICRLWLRGLRLRRDRQPFIRRGQARGGERLSARGDRRHATRHPRAEARGRRGRQPDGRRRARSRARAAADSDLATTSSPAKSDTTVSAASIAARLERSIDQVGEDFKFQKRPTAADIFDDSFLPPLNGRLIN